jgi:lipopolysaccharide heptosyltransferase II
MIEPATHRWERARRILAVRLDALGDVAMTGPALRALSGDGARHVTLLTSEAGEQAAGLLPGVDETIVYPAPWMKASAQRGSPALDDAIIQRLGDGRFDGAVIFTVHSQSPLPAAFLCYLAGIPLRAAHCRENPYQLLTEWVEEDEPEVERHEVERQLRLVRRLGFSVDDARLRMDVPPLAQTRAEATLLQAGVHMDRPWLLLHPGASAPSRRYPALGYAAAASRLVSEDGWQVVLAGAGDDISLVDEIRDAMSEPSFSVAGRLSLDELAAVIGLGWLFIGNNSGPAHIAAAVGTPSVVLYALTNPQHTPWQVPARVLSHDVPCRNCYKSICPMGHHACLRMVAPDQIVSAVRDLLGRPAVAQGELVEAG